MLARVPRFPPRFLVRLEIPTDATVRIEKTFGPGHYTVWGAPELFLGAVVDIVQIEH